MELHPGPLEKRDVIHAHTVLTAITLRNLDAFSVSSCTSRATRAVQSMNEARVLKRYETRSCNISRGSSPNEGLGCSRSRIATSL